MSVRIVSLRSHAVACGMALFLCAFVTTARAEEALVRCELQPIGNLNPAAMQLVANGIIAQSVPDNPISYRRGATGEWIVPEMVDSQDAAIRGFLLTPDGPLYVHIEALVDGRSFRAVTESWIDAALAAQRKTKADQASGEAPAAEPASAAPADESTGTPTDTQPSEDSKPIAASANGPAMLGRFQKADIPEWLIGYVRTSATPVERYEARWLIAQRAGGPALMELERYSTKRSSAPLVHFLDLDGDGTLLADEIAQAGARLAECDFNQDGNVDLAEIERGRPRKGSAYRLWRAEPLFIVIDDNPNWDDLARVIRRQFVKSRSVKTPDARALESLAGGPPQLSLRVRFGADKESTGVELLRFEAPMAAAGEKPRSAAAALAVSLARSDVEISAGSSATGASTGQISAGALVEGVPLWSLVDTDNDNRLSLREQGSVQSMLASLDLDNDGALTADEIPTRIRLAVAQGPHVHELLAQAVPAIPRAPHTPSDKAPDWFASMDTNGDGDLTIREFVGTADQFSALDKNGDGLLSVKEALQAADGPPKKQNE